MYRYRYRLKQEGGGYRISLPSLPEIVTQGDDAAEARINAQDALDEALANRIVSGLPIPKPDARPNARQVAAASPDIALRTGLHGAMHRANISRIRLARLLGVRETDVHRLLDPKHATPFERLVEALRVLGTDVRVEFRRIA